MLSIPLIRCDNKIFNGIIKQEIIGDQVFNEIGKQENTDETYHNDDSQLLPTGYEYIYNIIV